MRIPGTRTAALALLAVLAACSQENAPSETIRDATDEVVEKVEGTAPAKLAQGAYAPREDCGQKPGAEEFRAALVTAIQAKNAEQLIALAAPDVVLDFGGGAGTAELRKRLADSKSGLWSDLAELTTLGCGVNAEGGVTIPWVAAQPLADVETAMEMLVTGEGVPLWRAAADDAPQLASVSWDFVTLSAGLQPDAEFQKVETRDGKAGYIASDKLRSPLDYRIIASSRDGKWSFTSLVAGD
ncbi:hypothetical protein ACWPMX_02895 [Tsuneonella sp. HG094]